MRSGCWTEGFRMVRGSCRGTEEKDHNPGTASAFTGHVPTD